MIALEESSTGVGYPKRDYTTSMKDSSYMTDDILRVPFVDVVQHLNQTIVRHCGTNEREIEKKV